MPPRRRTRKTRRRANPAFNIVNAAELYLQTDVITRNLMGTNPFTALTGLEYGKQGVTGGNQFGKGGTAVMGYGYNPTNLATVTLPELMGLDKGSSNVPFGSGLDVVKANFKENLMPMLIQTLGVRAGFAIGKRLMSKQRSFLNNKVLKPIGLSRTVKV